MGREQRGAVTAGKVLWEEKCPEEGKQGNGGSAATAGMKVCKQSGSKESWECKAWRLKPQHGERRREQG